MKSTKTVLAVAIVIAGFAYAVGAGHPQIDSLKHSRCCGPQPEDIRVYTFTTAPEIVIPKVEGLNGFVLTDVISSANIDLLQDTGDGPEKIFRVYADIRGVNFSTGFPLIPGATITTDNSGNELTLIGYVY